MNRSLLLLVVLLLLASELTASARAVEPLFRAAAQVEFGDDVGQDFGSLFEVQDASGRVILGAGFPNVFNTCRVWRYHLPGQLTETESRLRGTDR